MLTAFARRSDRFPRRLTAAVPLAAALLLGPAGVAGAADNAETFKASASPYKLSTKTRKVGITLGVDLGMVDPAGGKPSALRRVTILFPAGARANTTAFPTCDPAKLEKSGPGACSKAQIGTGTAVADASPLLPRVDATMRVYNGTPLHGRPRITFWASAELVSVTLVFSGILTKQRGRYSYKLVTDVPHIPTLPGNPDASVSEVHVRVGKKVRTRTRTVRRQGRKRRIKGRTVNFIDSPRRCPSGGFPFSAAFDYFDGPSGDTAFVLPCP